MNRLTPLVLLVVVVLLGYFAYQQTEREERAPTTEAEPLFPGVELRRLTAVRLENLDASRHLRMERDRAGRWWLTDPMSWPAEPGLMDKVEQVIRANEAAPIPDALVAAAEASFQPPRGFLETEERLEDGTVRRVRVELGDVDLDGVRVYVRRDGRVFRTLRNFDTPFGLTLPDFRARDVFTVNPGEVVGIERVGGWYREGAQERLGMAALRDGYGWKIESPTRVLGDPTLFSLWTRFLSSIRAKRFASDRPSEDLTRFGLESPWLTVNLTAGSGAVQTVHFGEVEGRVYARRAEQPTIYEISEEDALRIREPIESFYESAFVRFDTERLRHLFLGRGEGSLRFSRKGEEWTVAALTGGEYGLDLRADATEVADLVAAVQGAAILRYFPDDGPAEFFPDGPTDRGIWVETSEGITQGGSFGEPTRTPEGTEVAPLLRRGSTLVAGVDPEFAASVGAPLDEFLARDLWSLSNARQRGLTIEADGVRRAFERADEFDWRPVDADVPARELDVVLDHLLFLKAERHLPEAERPELGDVVVVTFLEGDGSEHVARFGRTQAGEAQVALGPLRAVLQRPELYDDLLAIAARTPARSGGD